MEAAPQQTNHKFLYGKFREDKRPQDGFSKELISCDYHKYASVTTMDELNTWPFKGVDTLPKAIYRLLDRTPNQNYFGTKVGAAYQWMTVKEVIERAKLIAAGIAALDMVPDVEAEGTTYKFLGIQSKNRAEWYLTHLANMHNKTTTVAFYDTLGPDAARYICDQTELTTVACSADLVEKLCKLKQDDPKGQMTKVVNMISFEDVPEAGQKIADEVGIRVVTMATVIEEGKKNTAWTPTEVGPEDCATFSYTSGTTGDPKGVKLTHGMLVQCAAAVNGRLENTNQQLSERDTYISYLPAAHSFEQALFAVVCVYGMRCGFYSGDPIKLLKEDLPALRPTFFPSVPRIFNRVYGIIKDKISTSAGQGRGGGCKHWLIDKAIATKLANLKSTGTVRSKMYDKVVFKKFRAFLGGNVRLMITGSAPISAEVLDFLKVCFCCPIAEGYGMTETCAGSFTTFLNDPVSGHVGGPLANIKVRLRDIPEMGYLSSANPPKGEICMWGTSIMKGYFKNPEKTAEAFQDGWLLSGDVGVINPNGSVNIIDRAKNIFKLSQGEYIAPEKLENVYIQCPWLQQVWVYGDSLRDFILVVGVMDPGKMKDYAEEIKEELNDDMYNSMALRERVYESIEKLAVDNKFNGLEKPKNMLLLKDPFTVENDLLTPTMKTKRNVATKRFEAEIAKMYEEGMVLGRKKK